MIFAPTSLPGVMTVAPDPQTDERGLFARTWCAREFAEQGLNPALVQCSVSFNTRRGILRGMHIQRAPHEEAKLVRCTRGAIYDVALDLRTDSRTYLQWTAVELTADNRLGLYIPEGVAHGFQTLADDCEVFYQMAAFYEPGSASGVRWDDSAFGIRWPLADPILSERDATYPDYTS